MTLDPLNSKLKPTVDGRGFLGFSPPFKVTNRPFGRYNLLREIIPKTPSHEGLQLGEKSTLDIQKFILKKGALYK